jgi:nitroreductase
MDLNHRNSIAPAQLLAQLKWRYATQQFDPARKIDPTAWSALEESLVLTPSSFGLQPWKFLVVTSPETREELVRASRNQRQVAEASHLVVFAVKSDLRETDIDAHVDRIVTVRGASRDALASYRDSMVGSLIQGRDPAIRRHWATNQVYIALGNLLTSAALLGIDTCPLEGIERARYDDILGLEQQGLNTVVAAAVGYRAAADKYAAVAKVRFDKSDVLATV